MTRETTQEAARAPERRAVVTDPPVRQEPGAGPDYVVIVGQGRSGTNWLLDLFDLSNRTFCRNEPYGSADSALAALQASRTVSKRNDPLLENAWDEAASLTATSMGIRDHPMPVAKCYVSPLARRLGLYRMVRGRRLRRIASTVLPSLRRGEWPFPRFLGRRRHLQSSLPVLKLVQAPGWASFVLERRPQVEVVLIVRHPGGFLNSWKNRYLSHHDTAAVAEANVERLRQIVETEPRWADRFGDVRAMSASESELWYWVYANEVVWEAGQGRHRFHMVAYESLARRPVEIMQALYASCGLAWDDRIESLVREESGDSRDIARSWRQQLTPSERQLVESILASSPLRSLWSDTGD